MAQNFIFKLSIVNYSYSLQLFIYTKSSIVVDKFRKTSYLSSENSNLHEKKEIMKLICTRRSDHYGCIAFNGALLIYGSGSETSYFVVRPTECSTAHTSNYILTVHKGNIITEE